MRHLRILAVLIWVLPHASPFASERSTYSSKEYSFTLQYPQTTQLRTAGEGYFDLLKENQIVFQASVEDDAFKIFMHESKTTGDVFQSFARHRCKIICDADGPDGSVYCDKIASEKEWSSANGLRVMEFHLIMTHVYYVPNLMEANTQAETFTHEYRCVLPALAECLQKNLDACLIRMSHPTNRWKHKRTTNLIERSFKEVKRRVKVMEQFPTEKSCLRILFTLLQAQNEVWEGRPIRHFGNYTT